MEGSLSPRANTASTASTPSSLTLRAGAGGRHPPQRFRMANSTQACPPRWLQLFEVAHHPHSYPVHCGAPPGPVASLSVRRNVCVARAAQPFVCDAQGSTGHQEWGRCWRRQWRRDGAAWLHRQPDAPTSLPWPLGIRALEVCATSPHTVDTGWLAGWLAWRWKLSHRPLAFDGGYCVGCPPSTDGVRCVGGYRCATQPVLAGRSAFGDRRYAALTQPELASLAVEVSLLSCYERCSAWGAWEVSSAHTRRMSPLHTLLHTL